MKINIICSEANGGWIYTQFIEQFKKYSKHEILINSKESCDVCYALPYYEPFPKNAKCKTAWFSHQETKNPLKDKFIAVGKELDFCFSHSKKYEGVLIKSGVNAEKIKQVMPGVDLEKFTQRSTQLEARDKLVVGYIGRHYTSTNRKNIALLQKIMKLPFVELRATEGKISADQMPSFYADLDLVVNTATTEGGPLAIIESLAVGVPIMCYEDVGVANEFNTGCLRIPFNNENIFLARIEDFWKVGVYKHFRKKNMMDKMRKQVELFTPERFVSEHDKIWEALVKK